MALIFADFQISKKLHSDVGDNIIYRIEMCYIRAILKQSSNVSTEFGSPYFIIFSVILCW